MTKINIGQIFDINPLKETKPKTEHPYDTECCAEEWAKEQNVLAKKMIVPADFKVPSVDGSERVVFTVDSLGC